MRSCDVLAAHAIEKYLRDLHALVLEGERSAASASTPPAAQTPIAPPPPVAVQPDLPPPPPPVDATVPLPAGEVDTEDLGSPEIAEIRVEESPEVTAESVREELRRHPSSVEIEEALASLRAAQLTRSESLHWRLGSSLVEAIDAATNLFDWCVDQINDPPGEELEKKAERARKRLRRKLLWSVLRTLGFVALGVVAFVFLPLTLLILAGLLVVSLASAAFNLGLGIIKYFRAHFQAEFELNEVIDDFEFACTAVPMLITELARLHSLYRQFLDWSEIIGAVAHRPFGPPMVYGGRTHGSWVGGLYAHQVGEGEISADNMAALVSSQAVEVFRPSWLQGVFDEAADRILDRYQFMTSSDDSDSDPDIDNKVEGIGDPLLERSPRRFLLKTVKEGSALGDGRRSRMEAIIGRLSELPPGTLCDSVDGVQPESWLREAIPKASAHRKRNCST